MARQTRSQRRAQRRQQAETPDGGLTQRARARQAQVRPSQQPIKSQTGTARSVPGSGGKRFVSESIAELKKVDWPGQQQLIQGTAVVLIACLITGVYLFLADEIFRRFVQHVLLGG